MVVPVSHTVAKMPHNADANLRLTYRLRQLLRNLECVLASPAHLEQTIAEPIAFEGVGLHSGAPVTMRLLPAPAGSGIVFRRTDLDNFEIAANGRNVAKVSYATSLMRQGVLISTTEHLLSALIGMGVDNVIVELDNLELPILDGSALPYVQAFLAAGIRTQRRRRETIRVLRPVEVREGKKFIGVYPGPGYKIHYTIDFPAPIGRQKTSVDLAAETYGDLIGDLALAGRRIEGHVVAERAGHAMHTALVSRLLKDRSAWELAHVPVETAPSREVEEAAHHGAALSSPALASA